MMNWKNFAFLMIFSLSLSSFAAPVTPNPDCPPVVNPPLTPSVEEQLRLVQAELASLKSTPEREKKEKRSKDRDRDRDRDRDGKDKDEEEDDDGENPAQGNEGNLWRNLPPAGPAGGMGAANGGIAPQGGGGNMGQGNLQNTMQAFINAMGVSGVLGSSLSNGQQLHRPGGQFLPAGYGSYSALYVPSILSSGVYPSYNLGIGNYGGMGGGYPYFNQGFALGRKSYGTDFW